MKLASFLAAAAALSSAATPALAISAKPLSVAASVRANSPVVNDSKQFGELGTTEIVGGVVVIAIAVGLAFAISEDDGDGPDSN